MNPSFLRSVEKRSRRPHHHLQWAEVCMGVWGPEWLKIGKIDARSSTSKSSSETKKTSGMTYLENRDAGESLWMKKSDVKKYNYISRVCSCWNA